MTFIAPTAVAPENHWINIDSLLASSAASGAERNLLAEIASRAEQIRADLRLSRLPLKTERRPQGTFMLARGIAGVIDINGTLVHVVPKFIPLAYAENCDWQSTLLVMLARANGRWFKHTARPSGLAAHRSFIDHIASAYREAIEKATHYAEIRTYRVREEESSFLRGRLAVERQIKSVLTRPHIIHSDVDYLDSDNEFNQLLVWAGERLRSATLSYQVRRDLDRTLEKLPRVAVHSGVPARAHGRLPAQFRHYQEAVDIALMIARGRAYNDELASVAGYGFLVNTERVYERFVEASIKEALRESSVPLRFRAQVSERFAKPLTPRSKWYYTRPDNVIYDSAQPVLLLDAKYKRLTDSDDDSEGKPKNEDVYQLSSSMHSHRCPRGLLLYPRTFGGEPRAQPRMQMWSVRSFGQTNLVGAVSLSLQGIGEDGALRELDKEIWAVIDRVMSVGASTLAW